VKFLKIGVPIIAAVVAFIVITGVYQVGPSEVALVKTFGAYSYTVGPGIHFHMPYPFQSHVTVDVTGLRKIEIGFQTIYYRGQVRYDSVPTEAIMITGDGNMVYVEAVVQYRVVDPTSFAFNITEEERLVKFTTESVLRERVAERSVDEILTTERDQVAMETTERVQKLLESYDAGIRVESVYLQEVAPPDPVVSAFDDVNNARQDKERFINEALKYANDVVPKAEGQAQKILRDAEAYADQQILIAQGETSRFLKVYNEYIKAPVITRQRLLLETLQEVLGKMKNRILILDSSNTLKLLDITEIMGGEAP